MKICLASVVPGNDSCRQGGMLLIYNRLLSYYHIITPALLSNEAIKILQTIKNLKEDTAYES